MEKRFLASHLAGVGIILSIVLLFSSTILAKDWHELTRMTETELSEMIAEFQKRLDQDPDDYEMLKAIGIAYHTKCLKDPKKYTPMAVKFLTRAYEINRKDYMTMCYLGSATTQMTRTTWNPMKKGDYANRGYALMDKAVKKAPDNISVRLTRGFNAKYSPSFTGRREIALEDFEHLAGLIEKNPGISQATKKTVYANLVELYEEAADEDKAEKYRKMAENL